MILDTFEALAMVSAIFAILILGTTHLRTNLSFYSLHTMAIAAVTAWIANITHEDHLYLVAVGVFVIKAWSIPWFLNSVIKKINIGTDGGAFIAAPLSMHHRSSHARSYHL
jgi:hydrogenase-4 membrane subunit HyfE